MSGLLRYALLFLAILHQTNGADIAYNTACTQGTDTCQTANALCVDDGAGTNKCLCSGINGYYAVSTTCTLVLGSTCSATTDCTTTRGVTNSICSSSVCACSTGYTNQNNVCKANPGTACTAGACIEHASCVDNNEDGIVEICQCDSPYTQSGTTCSAAGVVAPAWLMITMTAVISMLRLS